MGIVAIWTAVIMAAVIALAALVSAKPAGGVEILDALGRATGIVGLVMLLLAAALSARVPGFDRWFGGLTRLWKTHHRLGAGSLILLLLHPVLLSLARAGSGPDAAVQLLFPPLSNWPIWAGWAGLLLMMAFLAPSFSFFGQPDYRRWKLLHRLAGPAVILALVHAWQYGRTLPGDADKWLWLVLAALSVGAVAWRFVFSRRIGRLRYRVEHVTAVANNLVELVLEPAGRRRLKYDAGQFVYMAPFDRELSAGYGEEHPYTLSSSPDEDVLRVAIKDLGDASRAIQTIRPGSRVTIEGPYGKFFPDREPQKQLWIAGGIGITPFLGRARHLLARNRSVDIRLVYCVQDEARARFLDELHAIAERIKGFEVIPHFFYRQGPLDEEFLDKRVPDLSEREAFVCGPPGLNALARRLLIGAGIGRKRIRTEEFELL
ncbi:MAG: ferric reductase-like transmembrane domain-containing protein [Wenzhouxiangellaceae bacterium]|nr:ferric reductase-like transmembrane domain-containing protein [Wenzhouxiangellaceae bacterium]